MTSPDPAAVASGVARGLRAEPLDRLRANVRMLGDLVGEIIREQAGQRIFGLVEYVRGAAIALRSAAVPDPAQEAALLRWAQAQSTADLGQIVRAFTVYFHMINLAEQHHRARRLRERAQAGGPLEESLTAAVIYEQARGTSDAAIHDQLQRLTVRPVFTAHPSEARRPTLLRHLEVAADLLDRLDLPQLTPEERVAAQADLRARITLLWQTGETRLERPTVLDEAQGMISLLASTVFDVAPQVQRTLAAADPLGASDGTLPHSFLRVGSWVGGDRDGNPRVTPEVSRAALRLAQAAVVRRYMDALQELGRDLSISQRLIGVDAAVLDSIARDHAEMGTQALPQWADEPYRRKCGLMVERLRRLLDGTAGGYRTAHDLLADLDCIATSMRHHGGAGVVERRLHTLRDQVAIFGLHLAELEFRQHAERFAMAVAEIFSLTDGTDYLALEEAQRQAHLVSVLAGSAFALPSVALTAPTREIIDTFQAIADIQRQHGERACQTIIISMCRAPSDMLAVLLLAREAGLVDLHDAVHPVCRLDVVPLFEQTADLRNGASVLRTLLALPLYRAVLHARDDHQQVMIGYSDSNKEAGYMAATWATYHGQETLAEVAQEAGIAVEFFHGRGGAVGRGGGPMWRAILSRPVNAHPPSLKVTEQGEVIFARYSHPAIARRHFEQILYALLRSSLDPADAPLDAWRTTIERLAERSRVAYAELAHETPAFLPFFLRITPFPELSSLNMASRPVSRMGDQLRGLADLRAIPWGFSWTQIRANLPGWYGLGTALRSEMAMGSLDHLRDMYQRWPFFTTAMDNAQRSLGIADMPTLRRYATLAPDNADILARIEAEYARSVAAVLQVTQQQELLERSSVLARSILLRNPYVDAIHVAQIALLQRYRAGAVAQSPTDNADLLDVIHHSINGIAAGLQETG